MLDSNYHNDIKIILKSYFCCENVRVCHMLDVKDVIS